MPSPLSRDLSEKHGVVAVDETSIDAFLCPATSEAEHVILFFTGDPTQRGETHDVAIILPQLLEAFTGRLRAAIIATRAEAALKQRIHVGVFPSLVVSRGGETLGVLPKVYDWPDYIARIAAMPRPGAPALVPVSGPRLRSSTPSARPRGGETLSVRRRGFRRRPSAPRRALETGAFARNWRKTDFLRWRRDGAAGGADDRSIRMSRPTLARRNGRGSGPGRMASPPAAREGFAAVETSRGAPRSLDATIARRQNRGLCYRRADGMEFSSRRHFRRRRARRAGAPGGGVDRPARGPVLPARAVSRRGHGAGSCMRWPLPKASSN